jgi:hypothetical protein
MASLAFSLGQPSAKNIPDPPVVLKTKNARGYYTSGVSAKTTV